MVGARDPVIEGVKNVEERLRALSSFEHESWNALDGDIDQDAEGAESEGDGGKEVGVLGVAHAQDVAGPRDECGTDDLGGDPAEGSTGPVRPGRDGSRDRLPVDVSEVLHRQAVAREDPRDLVQPRSGAQRHAAPFVIDRHEPGEVGEIEQHVGCDGDTGEAVPGTHRLDAPASG